MADEHDVCGRAGISLGDWKNALTESDAWPPGAIVLISHGIRPDRLAGTLRPDRASRIILVAAETPSLETVHANPAIERLFVEGRLVVPSPRGQSVQFLRFIVPEGGVVRLESFRAARSRLRSSRGHDGKEVTTLGMPEPTSLFGIARVAADVELTATIGEHGAIAEALESIDRETFSMLWSEAPYRRDELPESSLRHCSSRCEPCHSAHVERWRETDPHSRSLDRIAFGKPTDRRASCLRCHLGGVNVRNSDEWMMATENPLRLRRFLSGLACVSCHSPVAENRRERGDCPSSGRSLSRSRCRACHDSVNSPHYSEKEFLARLGCVKAAARQGE